MQFSDLQCLFNSIVTELICDDIRQFEIGDFVRIKKQNDSDNVYIGPFPVSSTVPANLQRVVMQRHGLPFKILRILQLFQQSKIDE